MVWFRRTGFLAGELMISRSCVRAAVRAGLFVVAAHFTAGLTPAQAPPAPSNTWIANSSGLWSDATKWDTNPVAPAPGTTTVLQFNTTGSASYTATNDFPGGSPFNGILLNATAPVTLDGAALTLDFNATSRPALNQNGPAAVTLGGGAGSLDITLPFAGAVGATNTMAVFGGTGSGTVTVNGSITGTGAVFFGNAGGATWTLANGGNTFSGGTQIGVRGQTVASTVATPVGAGGTPFGTGRIFASAGTLAVTPATVDANTDIEIRAASTAGSTFQLVYDAGGTVLLDKGGNRSLTFFVGGTTATSVNRSANGTLVITPASGLDSLGTTTGERLRAGGNAPASVNGIILTSTVGQQSATDPTGDYLRFTAATGYIRAVPGTPANYVNQTGSITSVVANEVSNITGPASIDASVNPYAVRVGGSLSIAAGQTLSISTGTVVGGMILNNATVSGPGTLDFGGREVTVYAGDFSTISATINSTATAGSAFTKFGPGTLLLTGTNTIANGSNILIHGGTLAFDGATANAALGNATASRSVIMRSGLLGLNSGTYTISSATPAVSITIGVAGGGFDVATGATLTLARDITFSTSGGPQGNMIKAGGGTLVVTTALTHNGPVQINGGTVQVNGTTAAASLAGFLVNNGGTLGGTGTINGAAPYGGLVTVNAGGTLAPGASIGTLTSRAMVWRPNGVYNFEHDPGSTSADLVTGAGTLDLTSLAAGNTFVINLIPTSFPSPGPTSPVTYTLATYGGGVLLPAGQDPSNLNNLLTFTGLGGSPVTSLVNGSSIQVTFTPVPEPAFVLLGCAAAAGLAARLRRRVVPV